METIYPEETLALLAKYDDLISRIAEEYRQTYPDPPAIDRVILGERGYAEKYHHVISQRRRAMLEDVNYQVCVKAKTRIIGLSPRTYRFDASELSAMIDRPLPEDRDTL